MQTDTMTAHDWAMKSRKLYAQIRADDAEYEKFVERKRLEADALVAEIEAKATRSDLFAFYKKLLAEAQRYVEAGHPVTWLCHRDGDHKRPLLKGWPDQQPTMADLKAQMKWAYEHEMVLTGFGVVQRDGRATLDFDMGDMFPVIAADVCEKTKFDLTSCVRIRSGRDGVPGYHVRLRTDGDVKKQPLAMRNVGTAEEPKFKVIVEVIGVGGQSVTPPSTHRSGRPYAAEHGDPVEPTYVPRPLFDQILDVIREHDDRRKLVPVKQFDRKARPTSPPPAQFSGSHTGKDVIEAFKYRNSIHDVLGRFGYTQTGSDFYKHPNGGDSEHSVHVLGDEIAVFFSPNDPMSRHGERCGGGSGVWADAFGVYCGLQYHGDSTACIRDLSGEYGMRGEATGALDVDQLVAGFDDGVHGVTTTTPSASPVKTETFDPDGPWFPAIPPAEDDVLHDYMAMDGRLFPDSFWRFHNWFYRHVDNLNCGISVPSLLAFVGCMLGKHLWSPQFGVLKNYSNLSTISLFESGEGKGPVRSAIDHATKSLAMEADLDLSQMIMNGGTPEALVVFLGGQQEQNGKQKEPVKAAMARVIRMCQYRMHGQLIHIDEAQDRLGKVVGEQSGSGEVRWMNMGTYLDAHTPGNSLLGERVVGQGWRGYDDACVTSVLYAQPSTFMKRYPLEQLRGINFTARFLPSVVPVERPHTDATGGQEVWDKLVAISKGRYVIRARIDEASTAWGKTGLLSQTPSMRKLWWLSEEYYNAMVNKISRLAGQMAQILSWIESWSPDGVTTSAPDPFDADAPKVAKPKAETNWDGYHEELDANRYFRDMLEVVARCHYNLVFCGGISRDATMRQRIIEKLRASRCHVSGVNRIMPVRMLVSVHFGWRSRGEVLNNLQLLEDEGVGIFVQHKFNGSRKTSQCFQLIK